MIATLANASLRAERKAAFVRLPLWRRYLARRIAQNRLTASAPSAASDRGSAAGAIGSLNFTQAVHKVASPGTSKMKASAMATRARLRTERGKATCREREGQIV